MTERTGVAQFIQYQIVAGEAKGSSPSCSQVNEEPGCLSFMMCKLALFQVIELNRFVAPFVCV